MKRFIILLISLCTGITAQAHFIAYQEWYNPRTGQILEEFYDYHATTNPAIDCQRQQKALIERARVYKGNVVVVTEDAYSLQIKTNQFSPISRFSPLDGSLTLCALNNIQAVNIERPLLKISKKEIQGYNDGDILNTFYKNYESYAIQISQQRPNFSSAFFTDKLAIDAHALHAITAFSNKHIILMAGAYHILSINNILLKLGWIPRRLFIPQTLPEYEKACAKNIFIQTASIKNLYENMYSTSFALGIKQMSSHCISIESIAPSPLLEEAPVVSERETKMAAEERKVDPPTIEESEPCLLPQKRPKTTRIQQVGAWIKRNPVLATVGVTACIGAAWWIIKQSKKL